MTRDSERTSGRAAQGSRPAARRRGVPLVLAAVLALVALVGGVVVGYSVRGEPAPAGLITEEHDVPVVTLTVEAP